MPDFHSSIIPGHRYRNAPAAIDWLCRVFGFERKAVFEGENGTIAHAELTLGNVETLTAHLSSVGYTPMDQVEMPGQFTRRGGILDIYSPEAEQPVRIEFFGDEIDTIRQFDPETQRSQSRLDAADLLPLTETPVTEHLLAAVHARLSKQRIDTDETTEEMLEEAAAAGGVSVFPGWEFFSTVAGAQEKR